MLVHVAILWFSIGLVVRRGIAKFSDDFLERRGQLVDFRDIIYAKNEGTAKITINREGKLNAFRELTVREMTEAIHDAGADTNIGVLVITGRGNKAFCTGGDIEWEQAGIEDNWGCGIDVYEAILNCPKPVVAMVNGYAIGGGHVLHVVCDLTIASETARFGQSGPRVGSYNAGYGTPYLARVVGQKKAREMWYLCRQYTAQEALDMGLVNKVVPPDKLEEEVNAWCREILSMSPSAIRACKAQFNADIFQFIGLFRVGTPLTYAIQQSEEGREAQRAFFEKRKPDFSKFKR